MDRMPVGFRDGFLLVFSPFPLLLAQWRLVSGTFPWISWDTAAAILCAVCMLGYGLSGGNNSKKSRVTGIASILFFGMAALPVLKDSPLVTLLYLVLGCWGVARMLERERLPDRMRERGGIYLRQAAGGCFGMVILLLVSMLYPDSSANSRTRTILFLISGIFYLFLYIRTVRSLISVLHRVFLCGWTLAFCVLLLTNLWDDGYRQLIIFLMLLPMLPGMLAAVLGEERFALEVIKAHPLRLLLCTFLLLCFSGTLLLRLPGSTTHPISLLDAAFTAVSAVCVTGLVVLDTAKDFTPLGQGFLLVLIQLGGLGIMSITSIAMYSLGKRMSLHQEWIMTSLTDTEGSRHLYDALKLIFKFTFLAEGIGALILSCGFYRAGADWVHACCEGGFTAVSAFCNAGFALRSDNLIGLQNQPLILYTVSLLIIAGGLTPSAVVCLPAWLRRRQVPLTTRLVFIITSILLLGGTLGILILEWNGILEGLSPLGKWNNAWFQSATLRTAGFNSVDLEGIQPSTFLLMNFLMAVGGSPGGTAGGFKTTVLAVLGLTFWNTIRNREQTVFHRARIPDATIAKAITIFLAYFLVLGVVIFMLLQTQMLSAGKLVFEAFSALGTVGLSLNATGGLDEIGRVIIIMTMFVGRIGPITLFMLLSETRGGTKIRYPDAKIPLN